MFNRNITTAEFGMLSEEEKAAWTEAWYRLYLAKDEAYLDGDYAKHGSKQATEWGE